MAVAVLDRVRKHLRFRGKTTDMKELADSFIQLLAIIMVMITLAVSTAAFSMMLG